MGCKFTCSTAGEESTSTETASNIFFRWMPTPSGCQCIIRRTQRSNKFPVLRSAVSSLCFHVTCFKYVSHVLIPDMKNFVPRIHPANRALSSNHASDHTSKVDVKFDHMGIMCAQGPSCKTSDRCHHSIGKFHIVFDGQISVQKNLCVGKERTTR